MFQQISALVLAIGLVAIVNAQLIDYDQLAGGFGLRKLTKKIERSTNNYQNQQIQQPSAGNYQQPQIGGGYQPQASAITSSYQQPNAAGGGYQPSASSGYSNQQQNKEPAAATYQNEKSATGTYGSSNAYDSAKVKLPIELFDILTIEFEMNCKNS